MSSFPARRVLLLAAATLGPRLLLGQILGVGGEPERWEYDAIAANITNGAGHVYDRLGFVYAAYAPPLWSGILAVLRLIAGGAGAAIQILQATFCFATAVVCSSMAFRMTGDDAVALLSGFLVAVQPSLLYYSVMKSDPLPLNVLLLALIAAAACTLVEAPNDRRAQVFGFLVGLGVLSRGTPVIVLPLVAAVLFASRGRRALRVTLIATAALSLCLAPWLIRNMIVLGAPLVTSTVSENFWRGNHEGASGGVRDLNGGPITVLVSSNPALPPAIRTVLESGTEMDRQEAFMSEAGRFLVDQPMAAANLFVTKLRIFWWKIDSDPADYPRAASQAYEVLYRIQLGFALIGAIALFRGRTTPFPSSDRGASALVLAVMIAVSLLQSAFYVQGRHRFLIEPLLLNYSASGIVAMARALRSRA